MTIYLLISYFDKAGGSEEPLTTLAIELKKLKHKVIVFSKRPISKQNQYIQRLERYDIPIIAWPSIVIKMASDWHFQDQVIKKVLLVCTPALFLISLAIAVLRHQPITNTWISVKGWWQGIISSYIHRDRQDALFIRTLDFFSFWQKPTIIHIFRHDLYNVLDWAELKQFPSIYYELLTPNDGKIIPIKKWQQLSPHLNKATIVTAISRATYIGLLDIVKIKRPIRVILPVFPEAPKTIPPLAKSAKERLTITCIARLSKEKGIEDLLIAASRILDIRPMIKFLIAGDGPLKGQLVKQAEELDIKENVIFYGVFPKQDLPKIMAMTDIFVLPSLYEGLPFVVIEAMAYGKPVVATSICGTPEVVEDQKTGFLVPPEDPKRLASALLTLIDNEKLRLQMGSEGRKKFEDGSYTTESFINSILSVYKEAIEYTNL